MNNWRLTIDQIKDMDRTSPVGLPKVRLNLQEVIAPVVVSVLSGCVDRLFASEVGTKSETSASS